MTSFSKLRNGEGWGVRLTADETHDTGDTVTVTKRNGGSSTVTLGQRVARFQDGNTLYRIAREPQNGNGNGNGNGGRTVQITQPGIYELADGRIFVAKFNKTKTRLYAKKLVVLRDTQGDRENENDEAVRIEFEYDRGAIFLLTPDSKMDPERARELSIRYGHCINCGKQLKVKKSLDRGMGPVCWKAVGGE